MLGSMLRIYDRSGSAYGYDRASAPTCAGAVTQPKAPLEHGGNRDEAPARGSVDHLVHGDRGDFGLNRPHCCVASLFELGTPERLPAFWVAPPSDSDRGGDPLRDGRLRRVGWSRMGGHVDQ